MLASDSVLLKTDFCTLYKLLLLENLLNWMVEQKLLIIGHSLFGFTVSTVVNALILDIIILSLKSSVMLS